MAFESRNEIRTEGKRKVDMKQVQKNIATIIGPHSKENLEKSTFDRETSNQKEHYDKRKSEVTRYS